MKVYNQEIPLYSLKKNKTNIKKVKITNSHDAYDYIKDNFYGDDLQVYESLFILMLNNSKNTVGYAKISQGGIVGTVVDIRIIAKYCIESLCNSIIMAHNHPSGKLEPSYSDNLITKKVKNSLDLLDIKLIDHLIITDEGFYSYTDEDKL